ncbi:hypothetical protein D3C71_1289300 [compost metagenome]
MLHDMIGVADVRAHFPVEDGGIFVGRCPEFALVGVQIIRSALGHDHFLGQAVIGASVIAEQILIQRTAPGLRQAGQRIAVSVRQIGQRLDRLSLRGIALPSVGRAFGRPVGPARGDDLQPGSAGLLGLQELGQLHDRSLVVTEYTRFVVHFEIGEVRAVRGHELAVIGLHAVCHMSGEHVRTVHEIGAENTDHRLQVQILHRLQVGDDAVLPGALGVRPEAGAQHVAAVGDAEPAGQVRQQPGHIVIDNEAVRDGGPQMDVAPVDRLVRRGGECSHGQLIPLVPQIGVACRGRVGAGVHLQLQLIAAGLQQLLRNIEPVQLAEGIGGSAARGSGNLQQARETAVRVDGHLGHRNIGVQNMNVEFRSVSG